MDIDRMVRGCTMAVARVVDRPARLRDRAAGPDAADGVRGAAAINPIPRGPRPSRGDRSRRAHPRPVPDRDRKSVVKGNSVYVRVDLGGRRIIKKKTNIKK